jgi:hypothetical protein
MALTGGYRYFSEAACPDDVHLYTPNGISRSTKYILFKASIVDEATGERDCTL